MNLNGLHYYLTLAHELSFTRAADRLYISQQALSKHIAHMEQECGVKLFRRRPVLELTQEGRLMMAFAHSVLTQKKQLDRELAALGGQAPSRLNVGIGSGHKQVLMPKTCALYSRRSTRTELCLNTGYAVHLDQMVQSGTIDLYVGYVPPSCEKLSLVPLKEDRTYLVAARAQMLRLLPPGMTLEEGRRGVRLEQFAHAPFLMLFQGCRIRDIFDRYMWTRRLKPVVALESMGTDFLLNLAGQGQGFVLSPGIMLDAFLRGGAHADMVWFPLEDSDFSLQLVVTHLRDRPLSEHAQAFIDVLQEAIDTTPWRV